MYQRDAFQQYFADVLGGKASSFNTYSSYLKRIDEVAPKGLDDFVEQQGTEAVREWAKTAAVGPFETYSSQARSILNSYLGFIEAGGESTASEPLLTEMQEVNSEATQAIFKLEKEMQAAVRRDLAGLEPGLVAIDGGAEVNVATGRIDILARDTNQKLVVIELKAGACPAGAIEQALGYSQALSDEKGEDSRAILIASSFSDRQRAAAKRTVGLQLRTYSFSMRYEAS